MTLLNQSDSINLGYKDMTYLGTEPQFVIHQTKVMSTKSASVSSEELTFPEPTHTPTWDHFPHSPSPPPYPTTRIIPGQCLSTHTARMLGYTQPVELVKVHHCQGHWAYVVVWPKLDHDSARRVIIGSGEVEKPTDQKPYSLMDLIWRIRASVVSYFSGRPLARWDYFGNEWETSLC